MAQTAKLLPAMDRDMVELNTKIPSTYIMPVISSELTNAIINDSFFKKGNDEV